MIVAIVKDDVGLIPLEEFRSAVNEATAVSDFCNEYTPPLNTADYSGFDANIIDTSKQWAYDFTLLQLIEIVFQIGVPVPVNLDTHKDDLVAQMSEKRKDRFDSYEILFEYPAASGKMFSCTTESQDNWGKLETLFSNGLVTYPFKVFTFDERDSYEIQNMVDLVTILSIIGTAVITERLLFDSYADAVLTAVDESSANGAAQPYLDL